MKKTLILAVLGSLLFFAVSCGSGSGGSETNGISPLATSAGNYNCKEGASGSYVVTYTDCSSSTLPYSFSLFQVGSDLIFRPETYNQFYSLAYGKIDSSCQVELQVNIKSQLYGCDGVWDNGVVDLVCDNVNPKDGAVNGTCDYRGVLIESEETTAGNDNTQGTVTTQEESEESTTTNTTTTTTATNDNEEETVINYIGEYTALSPAANTCDVNSTAEITSLTDTLMNFNVNGTPQLTTWGYKSTGYGVNYDSYSFSSAMPVKENSDIRSGTCYPKLTTSISGGVLTNFLNLNCNYTDTKWNSKQCVAAWSKPNSD